MQKNHFLLLRMLKIPEVPSSAAKIIARTRDMNAKDTARQLPVVSAEI